MAMWKVTGSAATDCDGITRRSFVQNGVLGVGGLGLADVLRLRSEAASSVDASTDTSVILFWLSGGPGHMETYDPKPDAVDQYRGPFGAISTSVPGIQFSEMLPEQAKLAHHMNVLRSVNHGSGDHTKGNHWMLTGFEGPAFNASDNKVQRRPAMGSVTSILRGAGQPGIPPYVGAPNLRGGTDNLFHYAAYLGGGANPFIVNSDPNTSEYKVRDLSLPTEMPFSRLDDRRSLLRTLDGFLARNERNMLDMNEHQQRAFNMLTSKQLREAFDINAESASVRDSYGRHTFGQSALLARRLVERGSTFVTVNCVPWDHHGTSNRYATEKGANLLIPPLDRAIAGLIRDLLDRGLFEKTLIVAMGEFGRTPKMNSSAGRDHWGRVFSVMMAGGNMSRGLTVGASNARGEYPIDRALDPQDVSATVYHHLGINAKAITFPSNDGRPMHLVEKGEPVRELVGNA
jgi:hypothetical protein